MCTIGGLLTLPQAVYVVLGGRSKHNEVAFYLRYRPKIEQHTAGDVPEELRCTHPVPQVLI